jgi:hypothetical protein
VNWIHLIFKKYSRIVEIPVRYPVTLTRVLFSELKLWYIHGLVSVQTVADMNLQVPVVFFFRSDEDADLDIVDWDKLAGTHVCQ